MKPNWREHGRFHFKLPPSSLILHPSWVNPLSISRSSAKTFVCSEHSSVGFWMSNLCPRLAGYKSEPRNPKFVGDRRRDSNPHCLVPKTSASCLLGYAGKSKDEG